jgi:hypothetical protein
MLSREEAQQLVLTRLEAREDARDLFIVESRTVERPFGWLFFLGFSATQESETVPYRLIIVNRYAGQVIGSSLHYTPERFLEIYETLLSKSRTTEGDWCRTLSLPLPWRGFGRRRLAKNAEEMGFYEIK